MMAALGAGLPVNRPGGNLVVDIGGGTTDIALKSMSGIVYSHSLRTAGNHMDEAIMNYVKRKYNLLIGERTAEQIKIEIGSASAPEKPVTMEVKGRSLIEGIPKANHGGRQRNPRSFERMRVDDCQRNSCTPRAHST